MRAVEEHGLAEVNQVPAVPPVGSEGSTMCENKVQKQIKEWNITHFFQTSLKEKLSKKYENRASFVSNSAYKCVRVSYG